VSSPGTASSSLPVVNACGGAVAEVGVVISCYSRARRVVAVVVERGMAGEVLRAPCGVFVYRISNDVSWRKLGANKEKLRAQHNKGGSASF
jgi:hypothetical protein